MHLVIDIGGTHTRVALSCEPDRVPLEPETYPSPSFKGIEEILDLYQTKKGVRARSLALGIPGPVSARPMALPNLAWTIDPEKIKTAFSLSRVLILNDVQALGYGILALGEKDFYPIHPGTPHPDSPMAVLAPGTGLGQSFLVRHRDRYLVCPSEGGHGDFAPADETQARLLSYLQPRFGHVSCERVCSGPGLVNLFRFLAQGWPGEATLDAILSAPDPARAVFERALADKTSIAARAVDLFVEILGAQAGNLALAYAARGGIFLGGGILPKLIPIFDGARFLKAFKNKGRLSGYLEQIPVKIVCNPLANLHGLCVFAAMDRPEKRDKGRATAKGGPAA